MASEVCLKQRFHDVPEKLQTSLTFPNDAEKGNVRCVFLVMMFLTCIIYILYLRYLRTSDIRTRNTFLIYLCSGCVCVCRAKQCKKKIWKCVSWYNEARTPKCMQVAFRHSFARSTHRILREGSSSKMITCLAIQKIWKCPFYYSGPHKIV